MAYLTLSTKCECGHQMEAEIKAPKPTEPTIKKLNCKACASIYLLKCFRLKNSAKRIIRTEFEIIELSPKLLEQKKAESLSTKIKKAAKNALGLVEPDFEVETELDQA